MSACWLGRGGYARFLEHIGEAPAGYWLDRIDGGKGYEPGNVRWVTPKESAINRAKGGPKPNPHSINQQALAAGMPYHRLYRRLQAGWPLETALNEPAMKSGGQLQADRERIWDAMRAAQHAAPGLKPAQEAP